MQRTNEYANDKISDDEEDLPLPPPPIKQDESPNSGFNEPPPLFGMPSLPEPTEKPPPPPLVPQDEPIYESIQPRQEPISSPPPPKQTESWKLENREAKRKQRIVRKLAELEEDDLLAASQVMN